jgi:hypothetical protein
MVGSKRPAARRASSVRFSTPNLLRRDEMWNFTVRTVMLSLDAISLLARLQRTECSTSRWRGLNVAGEATARPSSRSSLALATISPMTFFSAGTITTKSSGLNPRTRHCIANRLATRSRLNSGSFEEPARKWATPVLFSQKTKTLHRSPKSLICSFPSRTSLEKTRTLFNVGLVSASLENPRGSFLVLATEKTARRTWRVLGDPRSEQANKPFAGGWSPAGLGWQVQCQTLTVLELPQISDDTLFFVYRPYRTPGRKFLVR